MKRTSPAIDSTKPKILACDPSFTAWGWVVFQNHTRIDSGCIKTEPEAKKRRIHQADDVTRRASEIIVSLMEIIGEHEVEFIVSEQPHGSQNAKAAVMIGIVTGILQAFSDLWNIPIEWYPERDSKKALLGRISASKAEVIAEVEKVFKDRLSGPKYVQEAIADAMAIYNVAHQHSPTLKILTR